MKKRKRPKRPREMPPWGSDRYQSKFTEYRYNKYRKKYKDDLG